MDSEELKSIQRPLKQSYREDAASALVTLEAHGEIDDQNVTCSVATGRAIVEAGLHPASGGSGTFACSGDMLLQALVACAGVTLQSVATNRGVELTGGSVRAEGDLDFRGTMGVDPAAPVGFRDIRLNFELEGDISDEDRAALIETTERYCVVLQTLLNPPPIAVATA
ncbi:MAG: OsmC family protein [Thermoleophilaceae bacterium]|nr:OsmC family protein [Thermoleophilaceae bacterium]